MSDLCNVAGVVGDPAFFRIAETNAVAELGRRGLQLDAMRRHDWGTKTTQEKRPPASELVPPLLPGYGKIVVWRDPPIGVLAKSVEQCERYDNLLLILQFDGDTYDKRSKVLRDMDKSGHLHCMGLIRPSEDKRFLAAMRMIGKSEELALGDLSIKALGQLGHLRHRQVVVGGDRKSDRLVHDMSRIRQEAIKAQLYAGWGHNVLPEHVLAVCSRSHVTEVWGLVDAMFGGNLALTILNFDGCVKGLGDARKVLGLVKAQLEILSKVKGVVEQGGDRDPKDVAARVRAVAATDNYEMWDSTSESLTLSPLDEYRARKILELRHTPIWANCRQAITVCLDAHVDLVGTLGRSWNIVMLRMCLDICGLASR